MRLKLLLVILTLISLIRVAAADQTCGAPDQDCRVELGTYNIEVPERSDPAAKIPAMIYFHGAGGSGESALKNRAMVDAFLDAGYAVIAPDGQVRKGALSRFGRIWSFLPDRPKKRDELAFVKEVLTDAERHFAIDRDQVLMTGFSIGGSLTWYLACEEPGLAKAYAPVAGAFWRPHPQATDCKGPVKLLHTHGWRDSTVPLEGRRTGSGNEQGDVFHALLLAREINGCDNYKADKFANDGFFMKRWWTQCSPDTALQFNLFDGGHTVPKAWAKQAINWFEGLDKPDTN